MNAAGWICFGAIGVFTIGVSALVICNIVKPR